ncbi:nucleotidyltransferase family protein [Coleofasciculus sp. FACHB-SPT9]|uniref:nucleotidyltransferase family protein n=2 Tax=Cyanophyceae TaxID=3028117 RepID=UPI001682EE45|nr:nucleotidyltransferase family protein [Coleofasciculus sp. FACHB-SPT9]MBD1891858.1 nucleotidyltransferase family protein [Coleofasciculus sp. FACHB-SPT9]
MRKMNLYNKDSCDWLNSEQKLLLRAALLQGEEAIDSWNQWKASADIENLDVESYRLLPLLYRNLSAHGVTDLHMARLKGVYRRTWCETQVLLQQVAAIISCFQNDGITTMLLKDAALNIHYYKDYGSRMIHNFDFLVHPGDALAAVSLLQKIGWRAKGKIPVTITPFSHTLGFDNELKQQFNLRWHLFADGFQEDAEKYFWDSAILTKLDDLSTYVLNPTDQLLYVCVYGGMSNFVFPISRLADAAILLNSYQAEIDWNRLVTLAQKYRLILPIQNILTKLHKILYSPIPLSILQEVQSIPVSKFECSEYQLTSRKRKSFSEGLIMRYIQYSRAVNTDNSKLEFLGFPRYLQYIWGLEHLWEVPLQAMMRGIKRLVW